MSRLAVTALGTDRPGIVAAVTGVLRGASCNLEDTSMTILRGQFAMMLVVEAPDGTGVRQLQDALRAVAEQLDLVVVVRPVDASAVLERRGRPVQVTVHGADRPGIVHRVASVCAGHHGNVVDLATRVVGAPDRPAYVMLLELDLPETVTLDELRADLEGAAQELDVDVVVRDVDSDVL